MQVHFYLFDLFICFIFKVAIFRSACCDSIGSAPLRGPFGIKRASACLAYGFPWCLAGKLIAEKTGTPCLWWAIDAGAGGLLILDHRLYQRESRPRQVKRLLAKKAVAHIA